MDLSAIHPPVLEKIKLLISNVQRYILKEQRPAEGHGNVVQAY
jgi:hypothetical protein